MISEGHEPVVNFLSKVVAGDNVEAGQHFSDIMVDKINAALADQKVEVAHSMFGNNASVAEDADEDEFEEDISFLSQDEYDELPEDEKAEYEELPDGIDEENIVEYQRGLWRPPSDVNKTTGVAKTPKPAVARTVAKSPAAKPPKVKKIKPTTKPKKDRLNDYFSMPAPKKGS